MSNEVSYSGCGSVYNLICDTLFLILLERTLIPTTHTFFLGKGFCSVCHFIFHSVFLSEHAWSLCHSLWNFLPAESRFSDCLSTKRSLEIRPLSNGEMPGGFKRMVPKWGASIILQVFFYQKLTIVSKPAKTNTLIWYYFHYICLMTCRKGAQRNKVDCAVWRRY